jgi:hypothetical protein
MSVPAVPSSSAPAVPPATRAPRRPSTQTRRPDPARPSPASSFARPSPVVDAAHALERARDEPFERRRAGNGRSAVSSSRSIGPRSSATLRHGRTRPRRSRRAPASRRRGRPARRGRVPVSPAPADSRRDGPAGAARRGRPRPGRCRSINAARGSSTSCAGCRSATAALSASIVRSPALSAAAISSRRQRRADMEVGDAVRGRRRRRRRRTRRIAIEPLVLDPFFDEILRRAVVVADLSIGRHRVEAMPALQVETGQPDRALRVLAMASNAESKKTL